MRRTFLLTAILSVLSGAAVFAGSISLTTYYPSPSAAYDRLRLIPRATLSEPCDVGTLYTELPGDLRYCRDVSGQGTWAPLSIWAQNADDLYLTDGSVNPDLFVGIGTQTPGARLTVKGLGDTNATSSLEAVDSTDRSLFFINDAGHIGIGTNSPASPLELKHELDPLSNSVPPLLRMTNPVGFVDPVEFELDAYYNAGRLVSTHGVSVFLDYDNDYSDSGSPPRSGFEILTNSDRYQADHANDEVLMVVKQEGRVGIGKSARYPAAYLEVSASGGFDHLFMLSSDDTDGDLFTVKNDGKVGIGTNNPAAKLHIDGTDPRVILGDMTNPLFPLEVKATTTDDMASNGWNKAIKIDNADAVWYGGALVWSEIPGIAPNNFFMAYPSATPPGDFFIGLVDTLDGTSSPDYVMQIFGESRAGEPVAGSIHFKKDVAFDQKLGVNYFSDYIPTNALEVSGNLAVTSGIVYANDFCTDTSVCLGTVSDVALKKDFLPLDQPLQQLLQLRGVSFEWKEPGERGRREGRHLGFIAQDVEEVFPQWVRTNRDGDRVIYPAGFEALTVEALRELKNDAENDFDAIQSKIERLREGIRELKDALE